MAEAVIYKKTRRARAYRTGLKYPALFCLLTVLSRGSFAGGLAPFGFGAFLALVFSGGNVLVLAPLFAVAAFLAQPVIESVICAAGVSLVLLTAQGIRLIACRKKKNARRALNLPELIACAVFGNIGSVYIVVATEKNLLAALLSLVLGIGFMFCCVSVFGAVFSNRLKYRPDKTELAAAGVVTAALALGMQGIALEGVTLFRVLGVLGTLGVVSSLGTAFGVVFGISWGLGGSLYSGEPSYVAAFAMFAAAAAVFCDFNRTLAAAAVFLTDLIAGFYFNAYLSFGVPELAALAAGACIYLCLPPRFYKAIGEAVLGEEGTFAVRHIINRNRAEVAARLREVGRVFGEMRDSFAGMTGGVVGAEEASMLINDELPLKLCGDCRNFETCRGMDNSETARGFAEIVTAALAKGRVTLLELPAVLAEKCCRSAQLLSAVNEMAGEYLRYAGEATRVDSAKLLISAQLGGICEVMTALAQDTGQGVGFDTVAERRIMEELTYADILVSEAVITRGEKAVLTLIVKTDSYRAEPVLKIAGRIMRTKMRVLCVEDSAKAGFSIITLARAPVFDVTFGVASVNKNNAPVSGDAHTVTKISDDRLMVALCDGMGSGKSAERVSGTAISLVENFYRAGFDSGLILTSVNKLLTMALEETFSALDIVVVDLNTARCDFIKFGAPSGVVKRKYECEIVEGGALPIGALDEIRPAVSSRTLNPFDTVIIATDGVTDVFHEESEFAAYVNNVKITNPQTLATELVEYARDRDKQLPHDDMTCLAFRLIPVCKS